MDRHSDAVESILQVHILCDLVDSHQLALVLIEHLYELVDEVGTGFFMGREDRSKPYSGCVCIEPLVGSLFYCGREKVKI